jgi:hypothetical protein
MRGPGLAFVAVTFLVASPCLTPVFAQTEPAKGDPPAAAGQPDAPAAPKPEEVARAREVELVRSSSPRTLDGPQRDGLSEEAVRLFGSFSFCDPVACLGEAPKLVFADGKWTIRFPESYKKPDAGTKNLPDKSPAAPKGR